MSDNSAKVREAVNTFSKYIKSRLTQYNPKQNSRELCVFWEDMDREVTRLRRAFDTRRFFVVTIGALKAGKSTLINALTGAKVSPAGTGAETTKKCSIIMSSDDEHPEGITLYRYKKPISQSDTYEERRSTCEKATRSLMDYFKGICPWDNEYCDFERKSYNLHGRDLDPGNILNNLDYILTSSDFSGLQQFRDFLLAEIRISIPADKRSVLTQNVAVIDMPGLDGALAGVDTEDVYPVGNPVNFLPLFSHLFLLVQSSISGLNRTTASKLKEWKAGKRSTPVYLVFNAINSKSEWCNEQSIREESAERQKRAEAELKQHHVEYTSYFTINAAKAWESCRREEYEDTWKEGCSADSLYKESHIESLMEALQNDFSEQTDRIIQEDAVNGVRNALKTFAKQAEELKKCAVETRNKLNDERDLWAKILKCLEVCNDNIDRDSIERTLDDKWKKLIDSAKNELKSAVSTCMSASEGGETSIDKVRKLSAAIKRSASQKHIELPFASALNEVIQKAFENFCNAVNKQLDDAEYGNNDFAAFINGLKSELRSLAKWENSEAELKLQFSLPDPEANIDIGKLTSCWRRPWLQKTQKKYEEKFATSYLNTASEALQSEICKKLISYCISGDKHGDCLLNRRINAVRKHLEDTHSKTNQLLEADIRKCSEIITLIPYLNEQITLLDNACTAFERTLAR